MANLYDEIVNSHKGINSISIGSGNTTVDSSAMKPIHYDAGTTDLDNAIARQQWLADKQKTDSNDLASSYQESINKKALSYANQDPTNNPIINDDLKQHIINSKTTFQDGQSLLPNNQENNPLKNIKYSNSNQSLTEQNNNPLKNIENKYNNPKQKKLDDINIPISDDQKNNINSLFGTRKSLINQYNEAVKSGDYESIINAKSQIQSLNDKILTEASTKIDKSSNPDLYKQVTDGLNSTKNRDWYTQNADTKTQNMIQSKQDEQKTFMLDKKYKILQNTREIEALKLKQKEAINNGEITKAKLLTQTLNQKLTNMKITNLSKTQDEKDITNSISSVLGGNFDTYKQKWEKKTGKQYSPVDYNSVLAYGARQFANTSKDPKVKKIANSIAGVYLSAQNVTDLNAADQLNKLKTEQIKVSGKNYTAAMKTYTEKFKAAKSPEGILRDSLKDLKVNGKDATQSSTYQEIDSVLRSGDQSKMIKYLRDHGFTTYKVGNDIYKNGKLVLVPKASDYISTGTSSNTESNKTSNIKIKKTQITNTKKKSKLEKMLEDSKANNKSVNIDTGLINSDDIRRYIKQRQQQNNIQVDYSQATDNTVTLPLSSSQYYQQ